MGCSCVHVLLFAVLGISLTQAKRTLGVANVKQTSKLYSRLLNDYNKDVRPTSDQSKSLPVAFGPALIEVLDLDENTGHMILNLWLRMAWDDVSLIWDPRDYNGVTNIHLPAKDLWVPDVVLFNGFDFQINKDLDLTVHYDGSILWVPPATIKLTCRHEFRGNHWVCPMKFGSWTYNGNEVDLIPIDSDDENQLDLSFYMSGDQWEVVDAKGTKKAMRFNGNTFPTLEYMLRLRNKMLTRFSAG